MMEGDVVTRSQYDLWADYYDVVHTGLPGEAEFYVGQAVRLGTDTLELGCGTGRICIPMAMSGVNVVGLDNSKAMLEYCRQKQCIIGEMPGRLEIVEGDMRNFALDREFGLVVVPYRTFMHLLKYEDKHDCLECVYKHLQPDGLLILNLWAGDVSHLPHYYANDGKSLVFAGRYALPDKGTELVHFVKPLYDHERQLIVEEHILHEVSSRGEVVHTARLSMRRAWVTFDQMRQYLTGAVFKIEAVFGNFDCSPFTAKSAEMIWIARK